MAFVRNLYGDHCYIKEPAKYVDANKTQGRGKDFSNMTLVVSKGAANKVAESNVVEGKTIRDLSSSVNVQNKVVCYKKKKSFGNNGGQNWTRAITTSISSAIVPFHLALSVHDKSQNRRTIAKPTSAIMGSSCLALSSHDESRNRTRKIANSVSTVIAPSLKAPSTYEHPLEFCTQHIGMTLLEDEKLVQPGDKFDSHDQLVQYLNVNAKRWHFYYACRDSKQLKNGYASYTYRCVFLESKSKIHKRSSEILIREEIKTNCPCTIKLRRLLTEKELTAVYVCNHHDHELSLEKFNKLQHGRRLQPHIKEEIKDFLQLQVDKKKIAEYVQMETGLNINRKFFYDLEKKMQKSESTERPITKRRMQILNKKLAAVDDWGSSNRNVHFQSVENTYISDDDSSIDNKETVDRLHISDNEDISSENKETMDNLCTTNNVEMLSEKVESVDDGRSSMRDIPSEIHFQSVDHVYVGDDKNEETVDRLHISDNEDISNITDNIFDLAMDNKLFKGSNNIHTLSKSTTVDNLDFNKNVDIPNGSEEILDDLCASNNMEYLDESEEIMKKWCASDITKISPDVSNQSEQAARGNQRYLNLCTGHSDMYLLDDENVVKPGDKFVSHNHLLQYLNKNARRWLFYYKRDYSSYSTAKNVVYIYKCVFYEKKSKRKECQRLRTRQTHIKTDCPCAIKLRRLPNEKMLTVVYVCNHHDHKLSLEQFHKLQHGRRLPLHIREEIIDFLSMKVDIPKIRQYVEMETGHLMSTKFFQNMRQKLKNPKITPRQITERRRKILNNKIAAMKNSWASNIIDISSDNEENMENMCPANKVQVPSQSKKSVNPATKVYVQCTTKVYIGQNKKIVNDSCATDSGRMPSPNEISVNNLCATNNAGIPSQNETSIDSVCTTDEIDEAETDEEPTREHHLRLELCAEHSDMYLLENPYLVKPGDKFESHNQLVQYLNDNAKIWNFYYKCDNSTKLNTRYEAYTYKCIFSRNKHKPRSRGIRKRKNLEKTDCPCTIKFKRQPKEKELTAIYVCNHHNHELSVEQFYKLQHGRRLPSHIKEDINDFLLLQVDKSLIRKYVEIETGIYMSAHFFSWMKKKLENAQTTASHITFERLKILSEKIAALDEPRVRKKVDTSKESENDDHHESTESVMEQRWLEVNKVMDKDIQTSDIPSDTDVEDNEDSEFIKDSQDQTDIMNIKHEYVHKYNLDQYMTQPLFPKYLEILSAEQGWDVLDMLANVYKEKAMLKLSSIQKELEVITEIRYILPDGEISPNNNHSFKRRKKEMSPNVYILKEQLRLLKDQRDILLSENVNLKQMAVSLNDNTIQE